MLLEMKVPSPGESISEVEIATWLVEDGEYVEKDQEIAEVDSDKATLALPAEVSGAIKIVVEEGETVAVGDIVCIIDTSVKGEAKAKHVESVETAPVVPAPKSNAPIDAKATPLAKEYIKQNDVSPSSVNGTGEGGKILKEDVIEAMEGVKTDGPRGIERKKMSMLRRKVAQRLVSVKNDTAMLTTFNEVDMTEVIHIRKLHKEAFEKKYHIKLGFMSFFCNAVSIALKEYPIINSEIEGDDIIYHEHINLGIAVGAPQGLVVPVVRYVDKKSFYEIEKEISDLSDAASNGTIVSEQMMGATFTISNGGVYGSMLSTPILNPPQNAILGLHQIKERAVIDNGSVVPREIMYVALTYDHRAISGKEAVSFLHKVKTLIEHPDRMLILSLIHI